jgi:hypothetical protein
MNRVSSPLDYSPDLASDESVRQEADRIVARELRDSEVIGTSIDEFLIVRNFMTQYNLRPEKRPALNYEVISMLKKGLDPAFISEEFAAVARSSRLRI